MQEVLKSERLDLEAVFASELFALYEADPEKDDWGIKIFNLAPFSLNFLRGEVSLAFRLTHRASQVGSTLGVNHEFLISLAQNEDSSPLAKFYSRAKEKIKRRLSPSGYSKEYVPLTGFKTHERKCNK